MLPLGQVSQDLLGVGFRFHLAVDLDDLTLGIKDKGMAKHPFVGFAHEFFGAITAIGSGNLSLGICQE